MTASGEFLAVITAVATSLGVWFGVPKGLYELLALWRDRGYRRAKRAIELAKEFPDEPTFREHARRLTSAAMVDVSRLSYAQRVARLSLEAQSADMARAMASIRNDEQAARGVMSGHDRKTLPLNAPRSSPA
jgi:hypothetical protein